MVEAREHTGKHRIARAKRLGQTSLRADKLGINLHPFRQRLKRRTCRSKGCRSFRASVHLTMEDSGDQVSPLGEPTKERAHSDACPVGDLTGRGIHPRRSEQLPRRRNQGVDAPLGVGAQAALATRFRRRIGPLVTWLGARHISRLQKGAMLHM